MRRKGKKHLNCEKRLFLTASKKMKYLFCNDILVHKKKLSTNLDMETAREYMLFNPNALHKNKDKFKRKKKLFLISHKNKLVFIFGLWSLKKKRKRSY